MLIKLQACGNSTDNELTNFYKLGTYICWWLRNNQQITKFNLANVYFEFVNENEQNKYYQLLVKIP